MSRNRSSVIGYIALLVIAVALITIGGTMVFNREPNTTGNYQKDLDTILNQVDAKQGTEIKGTIEYTEEDTVAKELPDIETKTVAVEASTPLYAEIYSSPEKAASGNDRWMKELAEKFNKERFEINGKPISVKIRNVTSGQAMDYIASGKAVPDGFSPSNDMWVKMLNANGIDTEMIMEKTVGNIAGIVIKNDMYKELSEGGNEVTIQTVVNAVESGEVTMGYTNPFTSSTGLNFLVSTLQAYDSDNLLSDQAVEGFSKFQRNITFVSFNSQQMNNAAKNGTFNAFVSEYQIYCKDASMSRNYTFIPYGYRHDNPLVAISKTTDEKKEILRKFAEYCSSDYARELARECGFDQNPEYKAPFAELDGATLLDAQRLYKEKKDAGNPVVAVFIADTSGSMDGAPISSLKESLINSMKYIGANNYVGLVSYASNVTIERPIAKFDINEQAYFKGSVENLKATGSTATYDAVAVGIDMLRKKKDELPNAKLMLFVLSDGETNVGTSLAKITPIVQGYQIPIYTIAYNAEINDLKKLSDINEAANINATTQDVVYQLKQLFNANM